VIADLESSSIEVGHFFPTEEVGLIVHPIVGDEKSGLESQLLKQWSDKVDLRLNCVVESEYYGFVRDSGACEALLSEKEGEDGGGSRKLEVL
jgi:hypothetical protein